MKKLICMLMLIAMLIGTLAACGSDEEPATTTANNGQTTTAPTTGGNNGPAQPDIKYDENGYEMDDLPEDLDFSDVDRNFTILMWEEWGKQDFTTTDQGIVWSNELIKRQMAVEDRLGVSIKIVTEKGSWGAHRTFKQRVENDLQASEVSSFDLIGSYGASIGILTNSGCTANMMKMNYLNFEKPWWNQKQVADATVNGKLYFATGDITPTTVMTMCCVYGNKDLLEASGHYDLYDLVYDKEWTLDKLKELALDNGGDKLGLTIAPSSQGPLLHAIGINYTARDDGGRLCLNPELSSQKVHNWYATLQELYNEYDNVKGQVQNNDFVAGNAYFHIGTVSDMISFTKNATFNFIVLPMPKYDREQQEYITSTSAWNTMYAVPSRVYNSDMTGAVTEALASHAHRNLKTVVFDECFTAKFANDPENVPMIQLIYDTVEYDCTHVFADAVDTLHSAFNDVMTPNTSWTGILEAKKGTWEAKLFALNNALK